MTPSERLPRPVAAERWCTASAASILLPLTAALALLLAAGCGKFPDEVPSVYWISFDTFRADLIGSTGPGGSPLTPAIDDLAADSVVFESAFVPYSHTLSSHMSMLTGVYPDAHGVYPDDSVLPETISTITQLLGERGFATAGVVTSDWLKPEFGFGRGFEIYERLSAAKLYANWVLSKTVSILDEDLGEARPRFAFLHFYDAHSDFGGRGGNRLPYFSPRKYRKGLGISRDGREFCDEEGRCNTAFLLAADQEGRTISPDTTEQIKALYGAGVRYLDDRVGKLVEELKSRGLYDRALIIVTADHGEEFREHGRFIHSQPYDETVSVPLMIKLPGAERAGERVPTVVETIDIVPTVLDLLGIESPDYLQGRSLLPAMRGEETVERMALNQDAIRRKRYSLRGDTERFIVDYQRKDDPSAWEYYDLEQDPAQLNNLAAERGERMVELERTLARRIRESRSLGERLGEGSEGSSEVLSEEERKTLESLGYVD